MVEGSISGPWYVYVILCEDDSFYIGVAKDVDRRFEEHRKGQGAIWTKRHKPMRVVHYEKFDKRKEAFDREKELKTGFGRKWLKREFKADRLTGPK